MVEAQFWNIYVTAYRKEERRNKTVRNCDITTFTTRETGKCGLLCGIVCVYTCVCVCVHTRSIEHDPIRPLESQENHRYSYTES